ncbi:hypothetical protein E5Q_02687 [Mixia osmundae IAM 14324]|uniref:Las1-domain-containing protein n=1 Tax=Mixia osmundae (strain CBS 9802 / IAM 14324 / JCM 22182 / KY 12970) TaxID=764103 RepID=G7DZL7_MIXOS|nr:hypothetical protein E5Q_02687 [Mixia osmundae IAM 14324]
MCDHQSTKAVRRSSRVLLNGLWMARGDCPHAVESTSLFLELILADLAGTRTSLELRASYGMALTRFVSGIVDPAQQGVYARSIAVIAAQVGLPLWFVELRHASTHEALPSLIALRAAAHQALAWLDEKYWLPQMTRLHSASPPTQSEPTPHMLSEIRDHLIAYKTAQKHFLRDQASVAPTEITKTVSALWSAAEGTARTCLASVTLASGELVPVALGLVFGLLLEPGGLVPKAKKKRLNSPGEPLSLQAIELWAPLLDFLADLADEHELDIERGLSTRMTEVVLSTATPAELLGARYEADQDMLRLESEGESDVQAIRATLAGWIMYLVSRRDDYSLLDVLAPLLLRSDHSYDVVASLIGTPPASELEAGIIQARAVAPSSMHVELESLETRLEGMSARAQELIAEHVSIQPVQAESAANVTQSDGMHWHRQDKSAWQPCPLGQLTSDRLSDLSHVQAVH